MSSAENVKKKTKLNNGWVVKNGSMDLPFLFLLLTILGAGLMMLFSASYSFAYTNEGNNYHFILRQLFYAVIGVAGMFIVSKIDYHKLMNFSWLLYGITLVLLVLVYLMPANKGVHRWIYIGSFGFQPSEIAKFAMVLIFAHMISINFNAMKTFKFSVLFLGSLLGIVCLLVVFETHLSATILIFTIGIILMVVGGLRRVYIFGGIGLGVAAVAVAAISGVVSYAADRVQYWLDPWSDITGKGYQTVQSLLSIGSGGLLGRGIGQSMQKHLWIPEPHNDFIFSVVCEELGLLGAMLIVGLFCALVWRGLKIAQGAADKFGSLLTIGIVCQVGIQAMLNIMVVTNTVPNTGISLPFFSYGGTALMINLVEMGVVLSVSRFSKITKK